MFKTFLGSTIAYLEKKLEEAEKSDYVEKPLSWALYQTWKWVDQQEQPRLRQSKEVEYGKNNQKILHQA